MSNNLHDVDLKTPTHSTFEPPPPYVYDAPQVPYSYDPTQRPYTYPSAPTAPSASYSNIGFNVSAAQQQEYPHYPIGTGAYPGAGSYCPPTPPPNTCTVTPGKLP